MPVTVPTAEHAQALYDFIRYRSDEDHAAALADQTLEGDAYDRFFRISNCNKYGIAAAAESISYLLDHGDTEGAARAWHLLTGAGEQWRDHPDYLPVWQNPQLASVRQTLGAS
ncbi:hypothetical protein [Streptomyces sp. NPDC058084]|uniref:hypothetical protein n=1 Tax=Streptomyces sp. NPDC058084 TaxID=3346333 RepID=UPI0036ED0B40